MRRSGALVVVSNRLPATIQADPNGLSLKRSSGGLVTALRPVLEAERGIWIGWAGGEYPEADLRRLLAAEGKGSYRLVPVSLTRQERQGFYQGFSNEIVWPLFHDLQSRCNFDPAYWGAYVEVNRKFAQAVSKSVDNDSLVWVHDYHLMLTGEFLRQLGAKCRLGFFLHIPFPALDIFEKLPWRRRLLEALFQFDVIGFQTGRDQRNFLGCVRRFIPSLEMLRSQDRLLTHANGREVVIGSFPIGIDFEEFARQAERADVASRAREIRRDVVGRQIVLGVDRLDYTKGIPERLRAFQRLLASHPDLRRQVSLIQVVVPSREDVRKYKELKLEIQTLISQINGQYGDSGWVPIHYIHRSLERLEVVAHYRVADIALVTPLKDGMNLVAKEFCAAQAGDKGVLILSEFAGAADQLQNGAILVNPYDIEGVAEALHQALSMTERERKGRMRKLRRKVERTNVFRWCEEYISALGGKWQTRFMADEQSGPLSASLSSSTLQRERRT